MAFLVLVKKMRWKRAMRDVLNALTKATAGPTIAKHPQYFNAIDKAL